MAQASQRYRLLFSVDPNSSVDRMLKNGIHRAYVDLTRQDASKNARYSIVSALELLSNIKIPSVRTRRVNKSKTCAGRRFFSAQQGGLVEFLCNDSTAELCVQILGMDKMSDQLSRHNSSKRAVNQKLKENTADFLQRFMADEVEAIIFNGVMQIFNAAEDSSGPAVELFERHKPLFKKLKTLYKVESVANLTSERGLYSPWLAVDEVLATYEAEKDDESRRMMGRG